MQQRQISAVRTCTAAEQKADEGKKKVGAVLQQQGEDRKNSFPAFGIRMLLCLFGGGVVCGNGKGDDGQRHCGTKQEKAALRRDVFVNKP